MAYFSSLHRVTPETFEKKIYLPERGGEKSISIWETRSALGEGDSKPASVLEKVYVF